MLDTDAVLATAREVGQVAAAHATDADRERRVSRETLTALRASKLLGLAERSLRVDHTRTASLLGQVTRVIAAGCSSTGMLFAMHQAQAMTLLRHGGPVAARTRDRLATGDFLLASATTEAGTGGDVGRSSAALERTGGSLTLTKRCPVISYADDADAFLVTVRKSSDSEAKDQLIVLCERANVVLSKVTDWDAMGMRGTASHGYELSFRGEAADIFPEPFQSINARTHSPYTHLLWSDVWAGMSESCIRATISHLRKAPASDSVEHYRSVQLAAMRTKLTVMKQLSSAFADHIDDRTLSLEATRTIKSNALKISTSEALTEIALGCLGVVGIAAYARMDSPVNRIVRDALSAELMISNQRILLNQASISRSRLDFV